MKKEGKYATITEAARYPFKNIKRLFYWLWLLIPVFGIIVYMGYLLKLIRSVVKETDDEPPAFGKVMPNFFLGLNFLFFFMIYFIIMGILGYLTSFVPYSAVVVLLFSIYVNLIMPILYTQLAEKGKLRAGLNIIRATKIIRYNLAAFIIMMLKQIALIFIWAFASLPIITIIFSLPAMLYSANYLFADFYKNAKKPKR